MPLQILSKVGGQGAFNVGGVDQVLLGTDGTVVLGTDAVTGNRSQQVATMKKFADEFTSLQAASGWQKLPSGLIVQWGVATNTPSTGPVGGFYFGSTPVSFPLVFPTNCFAVLVSADASSVGTEMAEYSNKSLTGFTMVLLNTTTSVSTTGHWFAIGN